jgi:hypothetical protein
MSAWVYRVGRQGQAEALLDVLAEPALLPVGVLRAAQCEQDVIGLEILDGVRDYGHDAAPAGQSAGVGADRVHVVQHGVEALVGDMPAPIDVVGEPGKPPGEVGVST